MKSALTAAVLILSLQTVIYAADPTFNLVDLSADERLLFLSTTEQPGWGSFDTLFEADLEDGDKITALTHFPERSRYYPLSGELEIQNRYGLYRSSVGPNPELRDMKFYPSFGRGSEIARGRVLPVSSSPDGKWVLIQEPESAVRGNLVLYSSSDGKGWVISRNHVLDYQLAPGIWSPDSKYLLYSREDTLYYLAAGQLEESRIPDESYRLFGPGRLSNVRWAATDSLYYIRDSRVSLVRSSELLTRSFYSDPLPAGVSAGTLPVVFDSQSDSFWPAPDGKSILILKSDRSLFKFPLNDKDSGNGESLPFLMLGEESTVQQIWWRNSGDIFVLTGSVARAKLYLLNSRNSDLNQFRDSGIENVRRFAPSPDRQRLAILHNDEVSIWDSADFVEIFSFACSDPRAIFWIDGEHVLVAGGETTEIIPLDGSARTTITLSTANEAGFDSSGNIVAGFEDRSFRKDGNTGIWNLSSDGWTRGPLETSLESPGHRVFINKVIKVRRVDGFGNRDLFPVPAQSPDRHDTGIMVSFDVSEDSGVFNHGSRNGPGVVALVFNAIDNAEGLGDVLTVLSDYNLRVTFFVGGDFLRSQPEAATLIADSGHEIGSLFYTHMDLTDSRYRIDKDFVIRGLGRNEDEFFHTTGTEVSTLWHAPWYLISPSILDATLDMGYQYVGRDIDPLDWVVSDGPSGTRALYQPSAELVEMTLDLTQTGSIIPVRVGKPGIRGDYFFRNLELLINGLLNDGYKIVTVSELRRGLQ